jgi:gluconolactonase
LDREGRLVYASFSAGEIVRLESDGKRTVLASQFEGKRINGPNDLVVKSDSSIYFTDSLASSEQTSGPDCDKWWMQCGNGDRVPHKGVYFIKAGVVHLFSQTVDHPNGLAFSRNEKYLYVANTLLENILRFDIKPDGTGRNEQVFAAMGGDIYVGAPDGIKVDIKGNVYCTGPGGIWIFSPAGKHIGTILTPERTTNFTFGNDDAKTIYFVGTKTLSRISLRVPGLRP